MPGSPLPPQARWALTSLALSMLMPSLDTSIANAGLPVLARAFDASFTQVQWVVLAYLLSITALIVGAVLVSLLAIFADLLLQWLQRSLTPKGLLK